MGGVKIATKYLNELPYFIIEEAKQGYDHFEVDLGNVKRPKIERVDLRYFRKKPDKKAGKFACEGTETEACEHAPFKNPVVLEVHQRARRHGSYAQPKQERER